MPRKYKKRDPYKGKPLVALSWGCGIQSTTLAVMSAFGDMPKIDAAIFADTGWERQQTYDILNWYRPWLIKRGIQVYVVSAGDIRKDGVAEHIHIPFWTSTGGPLQRQCTSNFKIVPIKHQIRRLIGYDPIKPPHPPAGNVEQWQGISLDEYQRMRDSRVAYIVHRFPLVESRITRDDCVRYLEEHDLPVPIKSACVCCPYRSASEWLQMKQDAPGEWSEAIAFDEQNRHNPLALRGGSVSDELFLYKQRYGKESVIPLTDVDLEYDVSKERGSKQLPLILCDGGYCQI